MAENSNRTKFTVLANGFHIKGHGSVLPGARVTDYLNKADDFSAVYQHPSRQRRNRHT